MQKFMTDYLDKTCASVRGRELRQKARSELADHMNERYGDFIGDGLTPEAAALETIKRMGDPETLGRRISAANRSYGGLINALIGLVLFILTIIYMVLNGGELAWFIDLPSLISVVGLSAACGFLYCGLKFSVLKFLRGVKTGALYAGGVCSVVNIMIMLNRMLDDPGGVGLAASAALISLLYGLLLSVAARIAENKLSEFERSGVRGLPE